MPTICAFTCVRDAAWSLEAWYENVKDRVDQIVIQDGGSIDGSRELIIKWAAENPKLTAVLQNEPWAKFKWREDSVRNRCMGLFKTDWILLMDADELIEDSFWEWFHNTDHNSEGIEKTGYYIAHKNLWLSNDQFRIDGPWWPDLTLRLFKNHSGYFWTGDKHASLWRYGHMRDPNDPQTPIAHLFSFVHYHRAEEGYGPAVLEDRIAHHSGEKENLRHLVDPNIPRPILARLRDHPHGAGLIKRCFG